MAIRHWLYCRWKCVVCYKSCAQRLDPHRDILLCESCHPVFYKRKSSAKEQFGLTERDLHLIVSNGFEYLMTDLIFLARTKYGGKDGLEQRLKERKHLKMKREAEKECSLVKKESEVLDALLRHGSSYSEVQIVDSRFMPYVSIPSSYRRCSSQTADDAAKWLISMKTRYKVRYKALMEQILIQSSKCKSCSNSPYTSIYPMSACCHISNEEAFKTFTFIKENFTHDIQAYMKTGLLSEAQNGPVDCENWATIELLERAKRKENLKKSLQELKNEWPSIVKEGLKEPLKCSMAEDYIQKGVLVLQHQNGKCRLKKPNDVARVILAAARGWQSRTTELKNALKAKKLTFSLDTLRSECRTLIDDYIDHMVIVRNCDMVACSASEVVNEIARLQEMSKEQGSIQSTNSRSLMFNEQVSGEDLKTINGRKQAIQKRLVDATTLGESHFGKSIIENYITTGSINSLFGYKLSTPAAVLDVIKLKERLSANAMQYDTKFAAEQRIGAIDIMT